VPPTRSIPEIVSTFRPWLEARDERVLGYQAAIAQIPAPTGTEGERASLVSELLRRAGLQPKTDDVGNVVAIRGGSIDAPPVVVCAHLDTVFGADVEHRVSREGSTLRAPGIGDNARGLAALVTIAHALDATGMQTRHPVIFSATVGEEGQGNLRGARHLFSTSAAGAAATIVLDGPGDDHVVTHALGVRRFRVTFTGRGGHSWAAGDGPNAVHAAARAAAALANIRLPSSPRTTLVVARFEGGGPINAVASHAEFDVDLRSLATPVLDAVSGELSAAVGQAVWEENRRSHEEKRHDAVRCTITSLGSREAGMLDPAHPLAVAARLATEAVGRRPEMSVASTDANVPLGLGLPAIAIGAGGVGAGAHTVDEWFENREGWRGVARALAVVAFAAGGF
jgi:tripeptide aminopeptidase